MLICPSYVAIGIIGATVMPHSIFLGSALATQDRVSPADKLSRVETRWTMESDVDTAVATVVSPYPLRVLNTICKNVREAFKIIPIDRFAEDPKTHADRENNSYEFVRAHVYHGMVDIAISLLGLAVVINSL